MANFVHERHAWVVVGVRPIWQRINNFAGVVKNGRADIGKAVHFGKAVGHIAQKYRYVVIGLRLRIAARAGAKQHHARHAVAVDLINGRAETFGIQNTTGVFVCI